MKNITLQTAYKLWQEDYLLPLSPTQDEDIFRLIEDVVVELSDDSKWLVKAGFEYDGATVAWIFRPLFKKWGVYHIQSFIHDILYYKIDYRDRKFADTEHYLWGIRTNVPKRQNKVRYWILKHFGWIYWNKSKNNPTARALRNRELIIKIK